MVAGKVMPLSAAVADLVPAGAKVALGGMHMHNNPMALVRELVRQRRAIGELLTSPSAGLGADLLVGAGLVGRIATSYVGFEHLGLAPQFRRAVESGRLAVLEYDEAGIVHGLWAGAGGLPFAALPAGLELADVARVNPDRYRTVVDPFSGRTALAVAPLCPDVALIHAQEADDQGNAVLAGAPFTDRLMALAARRVVVQVERVVPTARLTAAAVGTTIPGFLVAAVVEAPGGCHPTAAHGEYRYDEEELAGYLGTARDDAGLASWLDRHLGPDESAYQEQVAGRLLALRRREDGPA